jgi:hypothetical protein
MVVREMNVRICSADVSMVWSAQSGRSDSPPVRLLDSKIKLDFLAAQAHVRMIMIAVANGHWGDLSRRAPA